MSKVTAEQLTEKIEKISIRFTEKKASMSTADARMLKKTIRRAQRKKDTMLSKARRLEEAKAKKSKPSAEAG